MEVALVDCAKSVVTARPELLVRPAWQGEVADAHAHDAAADNDAGSAAVSAADDAVEGGGDGGGDCGGGGGKFDSRYFFCHLCFRAYCNVASIGQSSYLGHRRIERVAVGDDHNC